MHAVIGRFGGKLNAMLMGKRIVVVLPAYKAEKTVEATYRQLPHDIVDSVLLVDDGSPDRTAESARALGIRTFIHPRNLGYGANQKTCYREALREGADIVVMVHPDYQYDPRLVTAMAAMAASGIYDVVLGSRILGTTARQGGMPLYKYIANRALTAFQNLLLGSKISEFHTGYRAYSRKALLSLPILAGSDDFVFDNQILVQAVAFRLNIGEISCPTRYFPEASSIGFRRSCVYGVGVLVTTLKFVLWKWHLAQPGIFSDDDSLRLRSAAERESGNDQQPIPTRS
jgi:glycosyltransferase involved in cell wall biosynthesis